MIIQDLLPLSRPFIVLDTETTGTDTTHDRIIELGTQVHYPRKSCAPCLGTGYDNGFCAICIGTGIRPTVEWRTLINPGIPIPEEASAIHGITNRMVEACQVCGGDPYPVGQIALEGEFAFDEPSMVQDFRPCTCPEFRPWPKFSNLASVLAKKFTDCDFGGKNVRFDLRITASEMANAGVQWSYTGAYVIDAERLEQIGEPRTLSALYMKHTGKILEGAHGALDDVRASTIVLCSQLETYSVLPRTLAELHELQWQGWIDPEGKFRFKEGVPCFGNWGKYAGKPMRSADQSYWDWIAGPKASFSADIKRIAGEAKLGKFPVQTVVGKPDEQETAF